ncbi:MAG: ROK family protein, partial [Nitrospirales bacterium]
MNKPPNQVLVVDVGGNHVKVLLTGQENPRKFDSGPSMTPEEMVAGIRKAAKDWKYDVVSIGYPGAVLRGKPVSEPHNLGPGWVGFDFEAAFGCPVKIINDAALQALGSYAGGKMLFLGLGTGLGSAMVVDGIVEPMELAHLPYRKGTFEDYVSAQKLEDVGKKKWREYVTNVVNRLIDALKPGDIVLGGGNVNNLKELPPGCRAGDNAHAFLGGFRLWEEAGKWQASAPSGSQPLALRESSKTIHLPPLTKRAAWKALAAHHKQVKKTHLRKLFEEDPKRGQRFTVEAAGLFLDYSKNRITDKTLKLLVKLAEDSGLRSAIDAMVRGEKINVTEHRAVLHVALRAPKGQTIVVDGKNVVPEVHAVLDRMADFSQRVRNGQWKGHTGKRIKNVINIGIGGSDLGPVMAHEALKHYSDRHLTVRFVSNVDGADFVEATRDLDPAETLFIVASKTFTT